MADKGDEHIPLMVPPLTSPESHEQGTQRLHSPELKTDVPTRQQKEVERKPHVSVSMEGYERDSDLLSENSSWIDPHEVLTRGTLKDCENMLDSGVNVDQTDGSLLHILAKRSGKGDDETIKKISLLIERGAKVDATDGEENTPLHIAAREGLCQQCEELIDQAERSKKSLVKCFNKKRKTALHVAAEAGQCEVVKLLLRRGADPNAKDKYLWFPFHYAVDKGHITCCRALAPHYLGDAALSKGQERPLMIAAKKGHFASCQELLAEKLHVDYQDKEDNTALHIVGGKGFHKFVTFLLDLKASLDLQNKKGFTPLMTAIAKDKEDCVQVLVERGASLTMKDGDENNILHIAAYYKSNKCMTYLLNNNDAIKLINEKNNEGLTPLFVAVLKKSDKCFTLLEDAGNSSLDGNDKIAPIIYFSTSYDGSDIQQKMLTQETNVNLTNDDKLTPLHIAAREGYTEACKCLLRKGARIDAYDKTGRTPLHWASHGGNEKILRLLLKNGAIIRRKDDEKRTALHFAASRGNLECCKVLLAKCPELMEKKDKNHKYVLDIAFQGSHFELFIFLLGKFSENENMKKIPYDLEPRFHSYVHDMMRDKNKVLLEAVIRSNWWEAGFGAAKSKMHGKLSCSLFKDTIEVFPDFANDIMDKCQEQNNFRLLEDNYFVQESKDISDTSQQRPGGETKTTLVRRETRPTLVRRKTHPTLVRKEPNPTLVRSETNPTLVRSELNWKLHHPVSTMVSRKALLLLQHPLTQAWLRYKWDAYARWIFGGLMAIRVFSIAMLVFLLNTIRNSLQEKTKAERPRTIILVLMLVAIVLQLAVGVNSWWRISTSCLKNKRRTVIALLHSFIAMHRENKLLTGWAWMVGFLLILVTCLLAFVCGDACDDTVYIVGILALIITSMDFIFVVDKLRDFNFFTNITRDFLLSYLKGLGFLMSIVMLSAYVAYLLVGVDGKHVQFQTMTNSLISLAFWQVGDFEQEIVFEVEKFRVFFRILFLMYLVTFGALIVTLIKTPSITEEKSQLNKEIGMIDLLFEIDVCFPQFRKVCEGSDIKFKAKQV